MAKPRKVLMAIGGIIAVAAVAIVALILAINPIVEKFRPSIVAIVEKNVQHPVAIGKISVSLFPSTSVELKDVGFKKADGSADKNAFLGRVSASTNIGDLLGGKLEVREISLQDGSLIVSKGTDGALRIGDFQLGGPAKARGNEPAEQPKAGQHSPISLQISRVNLDNLNFSFVDQSKASPLQFDVKNVKGSLTDIDTAGSATADIAATLLSKTDGNLTITGQLGNALNNKPLDFKLGIKDLDLGAVHRLAAASGVDLSQIQLQNFASFNLAAKYAEPSFHFNFDFDGSGSDLRFKDLFVKPSAAPLSLKVSGEAQPMELIGAVLSGAKMLPGSSSVKITLGENSFELVSRTEGVNDLAQITSKGIDLGDLAAYLPLLAHYSLTGTVVPDLKLQGALSPDSLAMSGAIDFREVSLMYPPGTSRGTSDNTPRLPATVTGKVEFSGDSIKTKQLHLIVAEQKLDVAAKVTGLPQNPIAAFQVSSPKLEIFPIAVPLLAEQAGQFEGSVVESPQIVGSVSMVNQTNPTGSVAIKSGKVSAKNINLEGLDLNIDIIPSPRALALRESTLKLFGGSVTVAGKAALEEGRNFSANITGAGIQMEPALLSLMGNARLTGTLQSLNISVTGQGTNPKQTVAGPVQATIVNGTFPGVNILRETIGKFDQIPGVSAGVESLIPEKYRGLLSEESTSFDKLSADLSLGGGRAQIRSVDLLHKAYSVTGSGWASFDDEFEFKTQLRILADLADQMVLKRPQLKLLQDPSRNIVVPVVVSRHGGKTLVLPDFSQLIERAAKNSAKDAVGKALDKKIPGAGQILDSLFR